MLLQFLFVLFTFLIVNVVFLSAIEETSFLSYSLMYK